MLGLLTVKVNDVTHHLWFLLGYEKSVTTRGLWRDHKCIAALHVIALLHWVSHTMAVPLVQFKGGINSFHSSGFCPI